jgi:methylated-DNA-[protein]-cysteine S-methyltransferase
MTDKQPERLIMDRLATPVGEARIVTDDDGALRFFDWSDLEDRMHRLVRRYYGATPVVEGRAPEAMRDAFSAYFAGEIGQIHTTPWRTAGTAFQRSVWQALCDIPPGVTESYGQLAARIGKPKAVRAVAIVVPCHRVIGASGGLTGYGGGLHRKRWLLAHEGAAFVDRAAA